MIKNLFLRVKLTRLLSKNTLTLSLASSITGIYPHASCYSENSVRSMILHKHLSLYLLLQKKCSSRFQLKRQVTKMNSKLFLVLNATDNYRGQKEKKMRHQSQMTKPQTYKTQRRKIKNLSFILSREELTSIINAGIRNRLADIF